MANESKSSADYNLEALQTNVQASEGMSGSAKSISATRNQFALFTKVEHDLLKRVASGSLRILLDESGNTPTPPGMTLVCRGTAWIEMVEKKVALFRA